MEDFLYCTVYFIYLFYFVQYLYWERAGDLKHRVLYGHFVLQLNSGEFVEDFFPLLFEEDRLYYVFMERLLSTYFYAERLRRCNVSSPRSAAQQRCRTFTSSVSTI